MNNQSKHRWEIAHKGHCKWFHPNHEEGVIEIFFDDKCEYNIENIESYKLDYDSKWYNIFDKLVNKEGYQLRIWKKADKQGHWYIDYIADCKNINVSEDDVIVNK
ncbi:MAG: hypothetical protein ACLVIU_00045 [Paraclostridium sp.]